MVWCQNVLPFSSQGAIDLSIVSIRKAMETKGCQALLVVIGTLMVIGMVAGSWMSHNQTPGQMSEETVLFTVAGRKVTAKEFSERLAEYSQQQQMQGSQGTAIGELSTAVAAASSYAQSAAIGALAQQKGVQVTEEGVRSVAERVAKDQIQQYREQLTQMGMIKAGDAPDAFDKRFTELMKKTPAEFEKAQVDGIMQRYADAKTKAQVTTAVQQELVKDAYTKSAVVSEEDLKKGFEEFTLATIRFDDLKKPLADREAQAKAIQAKAAGGGDFASLQKEAAPAAKAEERQVKLTRAIMENTPELKPLMDLKPGEVSGVVMSGGSPVIFKLVSVNANLPKDFESKKAELLENARRQSGAEAFAKDYKAKLDEFKPKFADKGLEIAYDFGSGMSDPENTLSPEKRKAFLEGIKARLRDPETSSVSYPNLIAATEFLVVEQLYQSASELEKPGMLDERIEAANRMLEFFEDSSFRLDFADELLKAKRNDDAFAMALAAAQNNGDYSQTGEMVYQKLSQMTLSAAQTKAWTDDQIKQLRSELERWQTEHQRDLDDQKKNEEEQKKATTDLDKDLVPEQAPKANGETPAPKDGAGKAKSGN